jgi:hypothetical protein
MRSFVLAVAMAALAVASVSGCHRRSYPRPLRKEPHAGAPLADRGDVVHPGALSHRAR